MEQIDTTTENIACRQRAIAFSDDFVNWTTPELMFAVDKDDPADVEHYNNNGVVYESQYIGILSIFRQATGCMDFQLINSHDGENWQRAADRDVFIPSGRIYRDWDFGTSSVPGTGPILIDDELWFYYSARWGIHTTQHPEKYPPQRGLCGGAIGFAKLRRDGFVSLDAADDQAVIETKLLTLAGNSLNINADCPGGSICVEVVDTNGQALQGMSRSDCLPFAGDSVQHQIQWREKPRLSDYSNQKLRLRFYWNSGSLYSFWCD